MKRKTIVMFIVCMGFLAFIIGGMSLIFGVMLDQRIFYSIGIVSMLTGVCFYIGLILYAIIYYFRKEK